MHKSGLRGRGVANWGNPSLIAVLTYICRPAEIVRRNLGGDADEQDGEPRGLTRISSRMEKINRRLPAGEFITVLALSITLGTWPLWDQHWNHRVWYGLVIGILALSACYFSGKERWRLEDQQHQRDRAQLAACAQRC